MPDSSVNPLTSPSVPGEVKTSTGISTPSASSPFPLLEAERQRLEQFTHDQLARISGARDALLADKRNIEQALEARRAELERQAQLLRTRLLELHEREKKASDRIEDALPERSATYRRRRYSSLIDKRKLEDEGADPEVRALREQLQELKQNMVLLRGERDAAFDELRQLRQQTPPPAAGATEESFSRDPDGHRESAPDAPPSTDSRYAEEIEALQRQIRDQQQLLQQLQAERTPVSPTGDWQRRLEQMKSERDAALAEVHRLVQEPEEWAKQEEEIVALNRDLRLRETKLQEELQLLAQEHQRLERTLADYRERSNLLDHDRSQLENRSGEFRLREERLRLREAELREMKDMIERDNIQARKELVEERQQVTRLREVLRQERENPRPKTPLPG